MSNFTIPQDKFNFTDEKRTLSVYQFDTLIAKHYFCRKCGIYPFHETLKVPGNFRINLGCVDELDTNQIKVDVFDGKNI